jgi:hypothetical protein
MYTHDKKIYYEGQLCRESHYMINIPYKDTDQYITVTTQYANRLDLVSYDYYGTVNYWYVIALASDIHNPIDVPVGTILRIPTLASLFTVKGFLLP